MEKELVKLYAPQLVTKEVTVLLESSTFLVYVTGAVARSGKLVSDRPLTALEAVIDAGVDYSRANLKSVTVIRSEDVSGICDGGRCAVGKTRFRSPADRARSRD